VTADEGFILKHPADEREQSVYARYQETVSYMRLEYRRRLSELNRWYDHQKLEIFDSLVSELEAINR